EARFDPRAREDALAGFTLRTLLYGGIDLTTVAGDARVAQMLTLCRERGLSPSPLTVMYLAADADGTAERAADFEDRFAEVSASITLGALLEAGLDADAPHYGAVHTDDLRERMADSLAMEKERGLSLENMASLPVPYSLLRSLRMLLVPPTTEAADAAPPVAAAHVRWCVAAYLLAR